MRDLVTPKQVARAIEVSESSIKRWCDKGAIPTQYTAGGHRRILVPGLIDFLRRSKYELVHPEALGLPATCGKTARVVGRARQQLVNALLVADEARCRQLVLDLYLAGHSPSIIFDDAIAAAFREVGDKWSCGEAEVYQERLGCEITLRVLRELRSILLPPRTGLPVAIGGAVSGDQYSLGTTMAEIVLRSANWNALSLGDNLPFETLSAAIKQHQPALFWISCSHVADEASFLEGYDALYQEHAAHVAIVVGGFALTEDLRRRMKFSAYCATMQHFETFAETLQTAIGKNAST